MIAVTVLSLIAVVYLANATRLPYLGGDIQDFIDESKRTDTSSKLSLQTAINKIYRIKRTIVNIIDDDNDDVKRLRRKRRSHMPYLGQNLDQLGVVRALPKEWAPPQKKTSQPKTPTITAGLNPYGPQENSVPYQQIPANFYQAMFMQGRSDIPRPAAAEMPLQGGFNIQGRSDITRPAAAEMPLQGGFNMPMQAMQPMQAMAYANMFQYPQPQQEQQEQYIQTRSIIPNFPAFYNQMQAALAYGHPKGETPKGVVSPNKQAEVNHSDIPHADAGETKTTQVDTPK